MNKSELAGLAEVIGSVLFLTTLFGFLYIALWIGCPC